ncbi:Uncharacterised protein [Candidatus Anstonella stagnisolia]|nr:Uncharacterised protein [Candidatus Anstonella stagnisolia]
MPNVSILAWRPDVLAQYLPGIKSEFSQSNIFACCQQKGLQKVREMGVQAFCAEEANELFKYEEPKLQFSIAHCRNLMQLASMSLGDAPLVLLDDDVQPQKGCESKFSSSFSKYALVQGACIGSIGNGIYMLVHFFDHLLEHSNDADFAPVADLMLRGVVRTHSPPSSLRSLIGGFLGINASLKAKQAFFPTKYPVDDHFYEFCCRHSFPTLKFMDESTLPSEIPLTMHNTVPSNSTSKLVDHYILYAKSAIVESYSYFRLCGRIPKLINGRHTLVKIANFDPESMCSHTAAEAALEKFRAAAQYHLQTGFGEPIDSQLKRVASLGEKDLFVPQEELEAEWENFGQEQKWMQQAQAILRQSPQNIAQALFAGKA